MSCVSFVSACTCYAVSDAVVHTLARHGDGWPKGTLSDLLAFIRKKHPYHMIQELSSLQPVVTLDDVDSKLQEWIQTSGMYSVLINYKIN